MAVHLMGTYLHFHHLPLWSSDCCMQGAIIVAFRLANIVVELLGDGDPQSVYHAQSRVTVFYVIHENAYGAGIIDFLETHPLAFHFHVNAVNMLRATLNLAFYARLPQHILQ